MMVNAGRRAFTAVEIMLAVAVLIILASLLVVGLGRLSDQSRARATRLTMENMRNMLAELELRGAVPSEGRVDAPGNVTVNYRNNRFGNAVVRTQRVMRRALAAPANRALLAKFASDQQAPLEWAPGVAYQAGDLVMHGGQYYRCTQNHSSNNQQQPPGGPWEPTSDHVPMFLDGWGNPIIYIPGPLVDPAWTGSWWYRYGLGNVSVSGQTRVICNPLTVVYPSAPTNDPDKMRKLDEMKAFKPFFASAGPDGDFARGDDNIYSFDN